MTGDHCYSCWLASIVTWTPPPPTLRFELDKPPAPRHWPASTPLAEGCNHLDPASWDHRDGRAFCRGCHKFMGRLRAARK